jgi:hypothetical protein
MLDPFFCALVPGDFADLYDAATLEYLFEGLF